MVVFLLMQIFWFPSSTDSVEFRNWVNFLDCKKICGIIFALSKDMLQCSENIWIGHSCFSVKKYACSQCSESFDWSQLVFCDKKYAFSCSSASGRCEHIALCHMFRKSWKPHPKIEIPKVWGVSCIPQPSAIYYVRIYAHICFLGGKDWRLPVPLSSNYSLSNKRAKKVFL